MADRSLDPGMDFSALKQQLAQREAEYHHTEKIQAALYEIADAASAVTDMQSFYKRLHEIVGTLMYAGNFFIATYDEQSGLLSFPYFVDEVQEAPPTQPLANFHGMTSWIIRTGQVAKHGWDQSNELLASGEIRLPDAGTGNEDGIAAPVKVEGKTIGVVFVQSYTNGIEYTDQDEQVLEFVAQHIAIALTRARAIEETRQRNREIAEALEQQTATSEILSVIAGSPTDVQPVFDAIVERAVKLCGGFAGFAYRVMDEKIHLAAQSNATADFPLDVQELSTYFPMPLDTPDSESNVAEVIRNRTILHVADMKSDPRVTTWNREKARQGGTGAALYIPLVKDEKGIGAIYVEKYEVEPFTEKQIFLVKTFADQAVIAIENVRLFTETQHLLRETEQRAAELSVINSVQEGLASSLDIQSIYNLVGDKIRQIFEADTTFIIFHDREKNLLVASYYADKSLRRSFSRPYGAGVAEAIIDSGESLMIGTGQEQEAYGVHHVVSPGAEKDLNQSVLGAPVFAKGEAYGAISVQSYKPHAFNENDLRLLTTLANSMSVALENVRLFDETQRLLKETNDRNSELQIINSVQQGLASQLDIQAIFDLVGEKVGEIFRVNEVCISTYDRETNLEHFPYIVQKGRRLSQDPIPQDEKGFIPLVMRTRQPIMINEHLAERAVEIGSYLLGEAEMPLSAIYVPLVIGEEARGVIVIASDREQTFTDSDLRLLNTLANSMSVALENARLFNETQQRNAELAIINSVQEGLASKLDMQAIYDLVGDKLREIFDAQAIQLVSFDHEKNLMYRNYLIEKGQRLHVDPLPTSKVWAYFIGNRRTFLINNVKDFIPQIDPDFAPPVGHAPKSVIAVPLMVKDEIRGAIDLENLDRENAFSDSDVRLLETLANSMSVALENARLWEQEKLYRKALEREFEIGREIQAGFLPDTLPQPKGWEIAASLKSAREVAGDFYDVFELPDERIGLVIGDVCDKGLGAALFMTLFRSLIRAVSNIEFFARAEHGDGNSSAARLKNAISLTNNYIAETHGKTGMFATVFFGILDTHSGVLTYVNGGHLPPVLVNKLGVKETLRLTGSAVGAIPDTDYAVGEALMERGDSFFAYTDGLTDSANPSGEFFSPKELIPSLVEKQPLAQLLEQFQKRIEKHVAGGKQFDDITMLALRRLRTRSK